MHYTLRVNEQQFGDLIAAIIIYLCGFVLFMKQFMNARIARREERAAESMTRLGKLRYYLQKEKERDEV